MSHEDRAEDLIARIHWRKWGEAIVHALCTASRYPTNRRDPTGERALEHGLAALETFADKPSAPRKDVRRKSALHRRGA